ncbi:hypothetical protein MKW92_025170 [Papaver armeniacum]|nr:hypothetical protein MKW92_025170 [Papaver armeniacum]
MADGSEKLAKAREELLILRSRLTGLLDMPEPFLSVKVAIKDYLLLLLSHKTSIHESRSDLQVDLGVLRALGPKLEDEQTEAEKEFFNAQMSVACAQRIKFMMLDELKVFLEKQIPNGFRQWIVQQLDVEDWEVDGENRVDKLQLCDARIEKLKRRAEAEKGQLREHKMDYEEFDADNPELVMDHFKAHQKALDHVIEKANENICACTQIPGVCESFKKLELSLEARCSRIPDDGIKEAEERQEAHQSKHTDDGAKARMAEGSETKLAKARQELQILRCRLIDLLDKPQPFLCVKAAIKDYVLLLLSHKTSIHESRSDLQVDLGILRDLRPKLEDEHTEAEQEFFNAQMSISCAHRIKSMMLLELKGFLDKQIPDGFHKWIVQQLDGENWEVDGEYYSVVDGENRVDKLQLWDARIEKLKRRAEDEKGQLREHKMDYEEFDADNPELVMGRFEVVTNICSYI